MNIHTMFKETTHIEVKPKDWTDDEKKIATDKAEAEMVETKARKTELEADLAGLGDIGSIQIKKQIEECDAIISEHEKYDVNALEDYTLRTDYVMSSLSMAIKYCGEEIRKTLIDNEFWEFEEEVSFRTKDD